jgi:DNA repair exonuclease SbcCD ATPase subunit
MDALSPIVDNLNHPNLFYWKKSGFYEFGDVDFYIYSIMDAQTDWPTIVAQSDKKVGIYHGPINGAKTDTGHTMMGNYVDIGTFTGLDLLLLGDIHRHQKMNNKNPLAAYASSAIQQNHGETLEGHGWLEWDLETKSYTFHELENDFGYATITLTDTNIQVPKLPKNVRLRIMTENVDASVVKKFLSVLKVKHNVNVLEVSVNKGKPTDIEATEAQQDALNINDISCQNKLIREYIEQNYPQTASEVIDKTLEINTRLNSMLTEDELPRNISWKPIKLKFDNLFSYGEGNEIDFENMSGLYGIFSPNATGKSSAFDALCFVLYDKTPRAFKGANIMNTRADTCKCEFEFDISQTRYKIVRTGNRKKSGEVKIDVEFTKLENGVWVALHGADRRDTNSIIRSYIGSYDDFVLTNLSVQNQNSLFIDKGQSEKKDLLSQFMGLTVFDRLFDMATDESKEIAGALKRFNKEDFTNGLINIQAEIDKLNPEYDDTTEKAEAWKLEAEELNEKIIKEIAKKLSISTTIKDKAKVEAEKSSAEERKKGLEEITIPDWEAQVAAAKEAATKCIKDSQILWKYELPNSGGYYDIDKAVEKLDNLETDIDALNKKIEKATWCRAQWKKKIEALKTHEYDPNCKYCINNQFVKDAKKAQEDYEKSEPMMESLNTQYLRDKTALAIWSPARAQLREYNGVIADGVQFAALALKNELALQYAKSRLLEEIQEILDCCEAIKEYDNNEAAILHNKSIDEEVRKISIDKMNAESEQDRFESVAKTMFGKLKVAISRKEDILTRIREAEELEDTYEAYENYLLSICRDGIPYQLISKVIPTVEAAINNILSQVVDFNVMLEVEGKNINGKIVYGEDRLWPLELASGMEKFISGLAIRVALMSVSSLPRSNFLVIDEGFSVLDAEHVQTIQALLGMLKLEFDFIIVISHLDVMRDCVDYVVEIKNTNGFSNINL